MEYKAGLGQAQRTRSLMKAPMQSGFRVVCVLDVIGDGERRWVTGRNMEPCWIGGSICAERSALMQCLQWNVFEVKAIYLVSDSQGELTPGMLCREFLLSYCEPMVPVIMQGTTMQVTVLTLGELFPYASVYSRITAEEAMGLGRVLSRRLEKPRQHSALYSLLLDLLRDNAASKGSLLHPIQYAGGYCTEKGSMNGTLALQCIEYGSSVDPISRLFASVQSIPKEEEVTFMMIDQWGVVHAPCGTARSLMLEHIPFPSRLTVLVHGAQQRLLNVPFASLVPYAPTQLK